MAYPAYTIYQKEVDALLKDLDLGWEKEVWVFRMVDLMQNGARCIQQAHDDTGDFEEVVEGVFDKFSTSGASDPTNQQMGVVGWGVLWFFSDLANLSGYDWRGHLWDRSHRSAAYFVGTVAEERTTLIRAVASTMANERAAQTLILSRYGKDRLTLSVVFSVGQLLDELREKDPHFQVVGPGFESYYQQYLDGVDLDGVRVFEEISHTLKLALAEVTTPRGLAE